MSDLVTRIKYNNQNNRPNLDITHINTDYRLIVCCDLTDCPFVIDKSLAQVINKFTRHTDSKHEKSKAVFDWMLRNITYDYERKDEKKTGFPYIYRNSVEVLRDKTGVCGEMAFLYITIARCLGVDSYYTEVSKDHKGDRVDHACATVLTEVGEFLVDPAYERFNVKHRRYKVLSDSVLFEEYRKIRYRW
jgi:transglutaminase-like putative cysteine protease